MFGKLLDKAAHQLEKAKLAVKEGYIKGDKRENARNNAMVSEMKAFKDNVIKIRQEISDCGAKTQNMMYTMSSVFSLPLPVAYMTSQEAANGATPVDTAKHLVGEAVNVDAIAPAVQNMQANLQEQVLRPLDSWLNAFSVTKEKNHKCEALRLDLDSLRKSVSSAEENVKSGKNPANAQMKLDAEKQKEAALEAQFQAMEAEIYNEMLVSIQFILDLRKYCIMAVQIMQEAMMAVGSTFDIHAAPAIAMTLPPPVTAGGAIKPFNSQESGGPNTQPPASARLIAGGSPPPPQQYTPGSQPGGFYPPPAAVSPYAGPPPQAGGPMSATSAGGGAYYPPPAYPAAGGHEAAGPAVAGNYYPPYPAAAPQQYGPSGGISVPGGGASDQQHPQMQPVQQQPQQAMSMWYSSNADHNAAAPAADMNQSPPPPPPPPPAGSASASGSGPEDYGSSNKNPPNPPPPPSYADVYGPRS
ncbi:hypothetical protein CEUSTIGMA_g10708.t1 [Chlamydomonas eustigma]|uniref:BAR domain-containing protein n=1 Tax=Chlamydomonas eustigma TaxID=1157962 RepID=A0A250XK38_9CHLO|nr:hypothetical protein CEUSTIGMA_g10708.t1 [Chlamydomonas eustigma]|eukprot:GAX83282.1 hypothetical protein CEUSTIGMA_g10708.t1 [Chlamydomonas eustigma]